MSDRIKAFREIASFPALVRHRESEAMYPYLPKTERFEITQST
jgi:hypothetical protein